MSLNCCQVLPKTNSNNSNMMNNKIINNNHNINDTKSKTPKNLPSMIRRKFQTERTWSGNIFPSPCDKSKSTRVNDASIETFNGRGDLPCNNNNNNGEDYDMMPKLIRSGGIRRDWSFENLSAQQRVKMRSS